MYNNDSSRRQICVWFIYFTQYIYKKNNNNKIVLFQKNMYITVYLIKSDKLEKKMVN